MGAWQETVLSIFRKRRAGHPSRRRPTVFVVLPRSASPQIRPKREPFWPPHVPPNSPGNEFGSTPPLPTLNPGRQLESVVRPAVPQRLERGSSATLFGGPPRSTGRSA